MLRPVWRLGRCQGVLSPQKGHLGPKTGFSTLAPASAWSRTLACQEYIPLTLGLVELTTKPHQTLSRHVALDWRNKSLSHLD